jgi:hypothetical protein
MGTRAPETLAPDEEACQILAEDLRTGTSAKIILERLEALSKALNDEMTAAQTALAFLDPGGLSGVIRHLRGTPMSSATSDADSLPSAISGKAGEVLYLLLTRDAALTELTVATGVIPPLITALRDAPHRVARTAAINMLLLLAHAQQAHCRGMADAGVVGIVLAYLVEVKDPAWAKAEKGPAWDLASLLMRSGTVAMRDIKQAMRGSHADQAFMALVVLQVCPHGAGQSVTLPTNVHACKKGPTHLSQYHTKVQVTGLWEVLSLSCSGGGDCYYYCL